MPAAAVVAAVASTALGVASYVQQRNASKDQQRAMDKQTTTARQAAKLTSTRTNTGASIKLGSTDPSVYLGKGLPGVGGTRTGTVKNVIGGLGASNSLGLY